MDVTNHINAAFDDASPQDNHDKLEQWNEEVEELVKNSDEAKTEIRAVGDLSDLVVSITHKLRRGWIQLIGQQCGSSEDISSISGDAPEEMEAISLRVLEQWKEAGMPIQHQQCAPVFRACKNWLRWLLQFYLPSQRTATKEQAAMQTFRSHSMLEIYMLTIPQELPAETCRHVATALFYATFNPIPSSDEKMHQAFEFLIHNCRCLVKLMEKMLRTSSIPLCTSLMRNVHNLASSYAKAIQPLSDARVTVDYSSGDNTVAKPDWAPESTVEASFLVISQQLLEYCIKEKFPGDKEDLRSELVQEILRTYYALRLGNGLETKADVMNTICHVMELPSVDAKENDLSSKRVMDCKGSAVSVLMDSGSGVATRLLAENKKSLIALLQLLELQIANTLGSGRVDDAGAASLTPILVVLYKFCQTDNEFCLAVQAEVFPAESEEHFRALVQEEKAKSAKAANMSPLDAPEGTLRAKLIKLLTWPQSHIKRFAGELLWLLSGSDPSDFVYRVGMGNGMPILGMKGFAQMPANAYS